jgi:acetyl esterase/lipase
MMKPLMFALWIVFTCDCLTAQQPAWQPSPGHTQVAIWPGTAPHARPVPGIEETAEGDSPVAGRPWLEVRNVSRPTMTVYKPKGRNTGAAVVVLPGGGYRILAIDLEGTEVCDWLTSKGITCVLLKYRVPHAGPSWDNRCGCYLDTKSSMALEDAQRTVGLVRTHAAEWRIDPHKIGVLGFSAGGHLAAALSTHFEQRLYSAVDAADKESCRPDFAVVLYPGRLWTRDDKFELSPFVPVAGKTPPTFLAHAEDDPVNSVNHSLVYYAALKKAEVPAEMHLYAQGGHAFGLRRTKFPITGWPRLVERWLGTIGMIPRYRTQSEGATNCDCSPFTNRRSMPRRQALPKNQTFFGFGLPHLTPALFGSQSAPPLPFCFASLSAGCPSPFCALTELRSWAEAAGTNRVKASKVAQVSLFIHAPFSRTSYGFG